MKELANLIAEKHGISTTTLANLVYSESRWDKDAIGDHGCSYGLVQINVCANRDKTSKDYATKENALDPVFALSWASRAIRDGTEDRFTVCNCYSYAQTKVGKLPLAQHIKPNTTAHIGAVAIMNFNGVIHYQVVTGFDKTGYFYTGANRQHCLVKDGHDDWGDTRLVGFYDPNSS